MTAPRSSSIRLGILLAAVALGTGCMENEIVAPDMLEDTSQLEIYYPGRGEGWESREARDMGFNPGGLREAVEFAEANEADTPLDLREFLAAQGEGLPDQGIQGPLRERGPMNGLIARRGYLVAEWGDTSQVDMALGVADSLLGTLVGLAADRGAIESLDDPVGRYVDDGGYASEHNAAITWRMSLQQTSEWEGSVWDRPDTADRRQGVDRELQEPGSFWEYNDVRVNRLALSASRLWLEALPEVLDREIMTPIGATRSWRWQGYRNSKVTIAGNEVEVVSGGSRWGGGLWIHSRDLARFGYLYLRQGTWRDRQLLSPQWISAATVPSRQNPTYGSMWWVNGGQALWPAAPATAYGAVGLGSQFLYVDPENELVVVVRWIQPGTEAEFISKVLAALRSSE